MRIAGERFSMSWTVQRAGCGRVRQRGCGAVLLYTDAIMSCLFCKIVEGTIPSKAEYQDDKCYAFADIDPKAPVHVLIVPREHLVSLAVAGEEHPALLGH